VIVLGAIYAAVPPVSTLMLGRWLTLQEADRTFVPLDAISPNLPAAVVASEDARFCRHAGVDWDALREVIDESDEGGPSRGASTIPMQVAKICFCGRAGPTSEKGWNCRSRSIST
jgi:monofunctional biosynthetic peptidoglycan transglycosylase